MKTEQTSSEEISKYKAEYMASVRYRYYRLWWIVLVSCIPAGIVIYLKFFHFNWFVILQTVLIFSILKLFFVGAGKPDKIRRRKNASQLILLTSVFGLQLILSIIYFVDMYFTPSDEEGNLILIVLFVIWLLSIALAIVNKMLVNSHNQI